VGDFHRVLGFPALKKNDHHDITEILLKVALNTMKQTNKQRCITPYVFVLMFIPVNKNGVKIFYTRVNLNTVYTRVDLNTVYTRVDLNTVYTRVNLNTVFFGHSINSPFSIYGF
jgi:hypothetical protein